MACNDDPRMTPLHALSAKEYDAAFAFVAGEMLDNDVSTLVLHGVLPGASRFRGCDEADEGETCEVPGVFFVSDIGVLEHEANGEDLTELGEPKMFSREDGRQVRGYPYPFMRLR